MYIIYRFLSIQLRPILTLFVFYYELIHVVHLLFSHYYTLNTRGAAG